MNFSLANLNWAKSITNRSRRAIANPKTPILFLSGLLLTSAFPQVVSGQILGDNTLPNSTLVNTAITPTGTLHQIQGGTTVGSNLFHSFSQFNVLLNETAYFNNIETISNIITRVTGGQLSHINGMILANGAANLFLINPSGIIFGENAQLAIGGSFFASTADSVVFADGSFYSATIPNTPLLTVSVPVGLQLGANPGSIINRSRASSLIVPNRLVGLEVLPSQTLALIGGDLQLEGGYLTTLGGTIQLASAANSQFKLNGDNSGLQTLRNINLSNGAIVDASGLGGGSVQLFGEQISLIQRSRLISDTFGNFDGRGIEIQGTQLTLDNTSYISTSTFGTGNAGSLRIHTDVVDLQGKTPFEVTQQLLDFTFNPFNLSNGLYSLSLGSGAGGNIEIDTKRLFINNGANILTTAIFDGFGGNITIEASEFAELDNGSLIVTGTVGSGNAGNLLVRGGTIRVLNGTSLSTTPAASSSGKGGDIRAIADTLEINGTPDKAPVPGGLFTTTLGLAEAGNLSVSANRLIVTNGAQISAASSGAAQGGAIDVTAESIELSGLSNDGQFLSGIFSSTSLLTVSGQPGNANAGNLTVNATRVSVKDGAQISVATGNAGVAGSLKINATESIEVSGFATGVDPKVEAVSFGIIGDGIVPSAIESNTNSSGAAGDLNLQTKRLSVSNGAEVGVRGTSNGAAGDLVVQANSIRLNNRGTLSATTNSGTGGNIRLQASDIVMRDNSRIATDAGNVDGGNIEIETEVLVAQGNSDITANAKQGRGGRVLISARTILGARFREYLTPENDITATSELGAEFSGFVDIQTLNVNPTAGLRELPTDTIDPSDRIASGCTTYAQSRFSITGRGGLPQNPTASLPGQSVWRDMQNFSTATKTRTFAATPQSSSTPQESISPDLVEANSWTINEKGNVELVAHHSPGTVQGSRFSPPEC
ncbi:filamentous hemagglutinin N-terminal domain-containing protein [Lusitaniella coriacea]|uniref:two-partner secretion domain-containing protein n=1 Tax=Lusitaniella coriacea TaxID=1983105 RepID=UPI003CF27636